MFHRKLILISVPLFLGACAEKQTDTLSPEARALFRESAAHIRAYTDSMGKVNDTLSWVTIDRRFEERLAKINFKFPPDTDLRLSQGENDTLYSLTVRYVNARAEARKRILKGPAPIAADSVTAADSIVESR